MAGSGSPRSTATGQARSLETRTALVRAAIEALSEVGYGRASAREIARRADLNQALVFYHFGSVIELLLAALDEVSAQRMAAYSDAVERATTLPELIDSARAIFSEDLDAGRVTVLVEMITGAQSTPGLGEQVAARLAPWRKFAEDAIRQAMAGSPISLLVPPAEIAHAVVAGFLGLELLANLDGDRTAALALFDRARGVAGLLELAAAAFPDVSTEGDKR